VRQCETAKLCIESHDTLAMQSVPKLCLALSHMPRPREAVRLEAVRLNGINHSESVIDFPPDIAIREPNAVTASRMDDFHCESKFYAFMESRLSLSAGHVPPE
jgi:hypothetical protein